MYIPDKISVKPACGLSLKTIALLFLIIPASNQQPLAQVADDFSDGDFISHPSWRGSTDTFIVNGALQLQLDALLAGSSHLYTDFPALVSDDFEWEFFVKQNFAPSGGNFSRFYLLSDKSDLSGPLNGYYIQLGEAGSNDAVELFRQTGLTRVSICRGTAGGIATSFAIRVKVMRQHSGTWELYADYNGGREFIFEASGSDATHTVSSYTGLLCTYTITNAARFYYDDIMVAPGTGPDITPPELLTIEVMSKNELVLHFSEALAPSQAENTENYITLSAAKKPAAADLQGDGTSVQLRFNDDFLNGVGDILTVKNISDVSGNLIASAEKSFMYFKASPVNFRDVIISEIFPDPSPQVGLPAYEFVELYNRGQNPVQLDGWMFSDGSSSGTLPPFILFPDAYVTLSTAEYAEQYTPYGQVVSVSNFPTLNNSGDQISVKSPTGLLIDSLQYNLSWYHDEEKSEGGWTMEIIDPQNICAGDANWTASESESGGTPGKENSVYAFIPDHNGPKLLSVVPVSPTVIFLEFNEKLENTVLPIEKFLVEPTLQISSVSFYDASLNIIVLSLLDDVQPGLTYRLSLTDVYDCAGNRIQEAFSQATFVLPEDGLPGDIIVNEVLFNPRPTGVDFVEIYNRSDKTIDLVNWTFANVNDGARENHRVISGKSLLISPNEYRVFTEKTQVLKGEYIHGKEENFLETDLPPLNDDSGSVLLIRADGVAIDSLQYDEDMHAVFLQNDEGVSLERITSDLYLSDHVNWRSASSASGYATPGYVNSNYRTDHQPNHEAVIVEPEIFRPLISGQDFTQIKYSFDRGGFVANIKIIDHQGRVIRQLAHNELLGTDGFFRWDGDQDNGSRARIGYYLVSFEIFDEGGMLKTYKRRVAVY
jgi:hypothetical protein